MLSLFKKCVDEGKITEAIMVGQNMNNRTPGDKSLFIPYYSFLCNLAKSLPSLEERAQFLDQANVVLSFFVENTTLTESLIDEINVYQNELNAIRIDIQNAQEQREKAEEERIRKSNDAHLKRIYSLKDQLLNAESKEDFDKILKDIRDVDLLIDKSALTNKQNDVYDDLAKENTEIMSAKIRELEHKERVDYNKKAAEAFREAFKSFQANEEKYKNQTQLFTLASKTLFAYDASKLFNETLIYYNHVYSYIFSKLDDDGKLALTRYSIECERNLG